MFYEHLIYCLIYAVICIVTFFDHNIHGIVAYLCTYTICAYLTVNTQNSSAKPKLFKKSKQLFDSGCLVLQNLYAVLVGSKLYPLFLKLQNLGNIILCHVRIRKSAVISLDKLIDLIALLMIFLARKRCKLFPVIYIIEAFTSFLEFKLSGECPFHPLTHFFRHRVKPRCASKSFFRLIYFRKCFFKASAERRKVRHIVALSRAHIYRISVHANFSIVQIAPCVQNNKRALCRVISAAAHYGSTKLIVILVYRSKLKHFISLLSKHPKPF